MVGEGAHIAAVVCAVHLAEVGDLAGGGLVFHHVGVAFLKRAHIEVAVRVCGAGPGLVAFQQHAGALGLLGRRVIHPQLAHVAAAEARDVYGAIRGHGVRPHLCHIAQLLGIHKAVRVHVDGVEHAAVCCGISVAAPVVHAEHGAGGHGLRGRHPHVLGGLETAPAQGGLHGFVCGGLLCQRRHAAQQQRQRKAAGQRAGAQTFEPFHSVLPFQYPFTRPLCREAPVQWRTIQHQLPFRAVRGCDERERNVLSTCN